MNDEGSNLHKLRFSCTSTLILIFGINLQWIWIVLLGVSFHNRFCNSLRGSMPSATSGMNSNPQNLTRSKTKLCVILCKFRNLSETLWIIFTIGAKIPSKDQIYEEMSKNNKRGKKNGKIFQVIKMYLNCCENNFMINRNQWHFYFYIGFKLKRKRWQIKKKKRFLKKGVLNLYNFMYKLLMSFHSYTFKFHLISYINLTYWLRAFRVSVVRRGRFGSFSDSRRQFSPLLSVLGDAS